MSVPIFGDGEFCWVFPPVVPEGFGYSDKALPLFENILGEICIELQVLVLRWDAFPSTHCRYQLLFSVAEMQSQDHISWRLFWEVGRFRKMWILSIVISSAIRLGRIFCE